MEFVCRWSFTSDIHPRIDLKQNKVNSSETQDLITEVRFFFAVILLPKATPVVSLLLW